MKYFTEEITVSKNGEVASAIFERDSENSARSSFHSILASAYINDNIASIHVEAKNSVGGIYDTETYVAPIEPDPEHPDIP